MRSRFVFARHWTPKRVQKLQDVSQVAASLLYVADNRLRQYSGEVHRVDDIETGSRSVVGAAVVSSVAGLRHRRSGLLLHQKRNDALNAL
jgi:hypothetical protein